MSFRFQGKLGKRLNVPSIIENRLGAIKNRMIFMFPLIKKTSTSEKLYALYGNVFWAMKTKYFMMEAFFYL